MAYNDIPSEQQALFDVACNCAFNRSEKQCSATFGSSTCTGCKWNLFEYVDADPRKAKLLMLSAERSIRILASTRRSVDSFARFIDTLVVITAVIIITLIVLAVKGCQLEQAERAAEAAAKPQAQVILSTENKVDKALSKVALNYKDVNGDGLVNCIDAAVLFYKYYPDKNDVTIELNYNTKTGMNHLFNVVNFQGTWRAIEPQAKATGNSRYFMRDVWGSKYDPAYNKVVTKDYIKYVKN